MDVLPQSASKIDELVVNWHVIKACNFSCGFCYGIFSDAGQELWKQPTEAHGLVKALSSFFAPGNPSNPLASKIDYSSVRLSVAGGEPTLLGEKLVRILAHAKSLGLRTALITNGSRPAVIIEAAPYIDVLTISIDSLSPATNTIIGRLDRKGNCLGLDHIAGLVRRVREFRADVTIKVNTVVNEANADECLSELILAVRPDRWKLMRMLPIITEKFSIEQAAFQRFVDRHEAFRSLLTVEDNADMVDSYIMVDPFGRFFQNSSENAGYLYSKPILKVGAEAAFTDITFDLLKFASRYGTTLQRGSL